MLLVPFKLPENILKVEVFWCFKMCRRRLVTLNRLRKILKNLWTQCFTWKFFIHFWQVGVIWWSWNGKRQQLASHSKFVSFVVQALCYWLSNDLSDTKIGARYLHISLRFQNIFKNIIFQILRAFCAANWIQSAQKESMLSH